MMATDIKARYHGKPLLIYLENLVLHSIGALEPSKFEGLRSTEGRLRRLYGHDGSWVDMLKAELELDPDFEDRVRAFYDRNVDEARARGYRVDPNTFARSFVDTLFPLDSAR